MLGEITRTREPDYKINVVRDLLTAAFSREGLLNLCYRWEFKEVYDQITPADSPSTIARELVDYAHRNGRIEALLEIIKAENPLQYRVYYPNIIESGTISAPESRKLPTDQPSPISVMQIEQTRQDIQCLNRCVELFQDTEKNRRRLREFFDTTEDMLNRWNDSWEERWKANRSVIVSKYVPDYVEVSLQLSQYLERLSSGRGLLQEYQWEEIEKSIRVLERAQEDAEKSKEQLSRLCNELVCDGWSEVVKRQISAEIIELENALMKLNNQIPKIRDELYEKIKFFVKRLARRYHIDEEKSNHE
jgi:hypothetical protein